MRCMRVLLVLASLLAGPAATGDARTTLPAPVSAELARHGLSPANLSVYVQDVSRSAPLLTVNAEAPRNPASVMKLLTTLVALHELGPAYRFPTDVYAERAPLRGRLDGDLYLAGHGDPFLVTESFWRLLKDLRQAGLAHVTGDLVLDGSHFEVPAIDRAAFDGKPHRAYNVPPHAVLVNFFATRFKFFSDGEGEHARIVVDPPMATLRLDNQLRLGDAGCSWRNRELTMDLRSIGPVPAVRFRGVLPRGCRAFELLRAVAEPVPYVFGAFKPMWEEMGGRIDGKGRAGLVPDGAVRLHRALSWPLADLLRTMNKHSNNVMSRNLLLALGAHTYGEPGTLDKGRRAIADWLLLNEVEAPELMVDNGSGLSRESRISALSLARALLAGWRSPYRAEFVSSLPLAALDGTMRKRFRASDLEGRAHLKTGLLNGVRSIGGFLLTRSGRNLVLVSLHNEPGVQYGTGTQVQDALIEWLFEQ